MNNVNRAFIKVYRGHDAASDADDELRDGRPETPAATPIEQAQGTCVVGVWTGDGESTAGTGGGNRQNGDAGEFQSPPSVPRRSGSHLPAVLAAAATAPAPDLSEFDDRAAGVEYPRAFVPLPRAGSTDAAPAQPEPGPSHFSRAQASPAPRAKVIVVNEPAHEVPAPHFDVAAVAAKTDTAVVAETDTAVAADTGTAVAADTGTAVAAETGRPEQREDLPESPPPTADDAAADTGPFRPAWEVDNFAWPDVIGELFAEQPDRFDALAEHVIQLADAGAKKIAVVGSCPGAGSTTLALCLALRLSEVVQQVALVDGNVGNPTLAADLDVCLESGWEDVLAGRQVAEEVAATSVENGITLLPLLNPDLVPDVPAVSERAAEVQKRLAASHDIVLVDAGPVWGKGIELLTSGEKQPAVDAAVLVRDVRQTAERELRVAIAELASRGIAVVAIAENFQAVAAAEGVRKAA